MRENSEITIVFDFDGVICHNNSGSYSDAPPYMFSIAQINMVYDLGYRVVIATARYGKRHPGAQYQYGYVEALDWLKAHGVKFHELHMGKPAGAMYVDDKACQVRGQHPEDWDDFWIKLQTLNEVDEYNQPSQKGT